MTKEELEKEAEEWIAKNSKEFIANPKYSPFDYAKAIYLAGAEPREKRIAELIALINAERERQEKCDDVHLQTIAELEKENAELKKNYEDSLVAYGVLKNKVELLSQPSPLESMQDVLITTQKAQNEKQKDQLTKAKVLLKIGMEGIKREFLLDGNGNKPFAQEAIKLCNQFCEEAEQFLNSEVEK